jgi:hypothetical protein
MQKTKPEVKKEAYEKPESFKEGNLRDITAGGTVKPND